MPRVAVIGSTGQLGFDLVRVLREPSLPLSPTRKGEPAGFEAIPLSHRDIEITDPGSVHTVLMAVRPEIIINCAAFVRVDECEDRPEEALRVNALGALHVARACAEVDALCVFISTDYVFDGGKTEPYTEEDPPRPLNVYGISKLCGEYFVRASCPRHLIVRTSGLYGVAGSRGKGGNFVETMIHMAREGKPIRVVDDQVLAPTYTKDLAEKIKELLQGQVSGVIHLASSGQCSWYEFARRIFELMGIQADLNPVTSRVYGTRAQRPAYSVLRSTRLEELGLMPLRPWYEALEAYLSEKGYLPLEEKN
ncbi:MAG: dTDP-4-dehydrorhamnose reductase [Armatimonadota bacterium]|nr:dTDP-4-dehydrorhamnose reductase [Armatimonadota bacterium]MDR5702781.1 dTDP-4-dehydrorhamnose reductase [Armatimonadota bacterium]